jgi:hypothetical protein
MRTEAKGREQQVAGVTHFRETLKAKDLDFILYVLGSKDDSCSWENGR